METYITEFMVDVLEYEKHDTLENAYREPGGKWSCPDPYEDLNLAMLGVEKLIAPDNRYSHFSMVFYRQWECRLTDQPYMVIPENAPFSYGEGDTPNEAIIEACLRITSPELFEKE